MATPQRSDYDPTEELAASERQGADTTNGQYGPLRVVKDDERESSADDARTGEETTGGQWQNNVTPFEEQATNRFQAIKKGGPLGLIIGLLVTGGFGMSVLFSPGLMLVHWKETLMSKFNHQDSVLNHRSKKMIISKITGSNDGATKGSCGTVTIRCKYNRMSNTLIERFNKAGIEVIDVDGKPIKPDDSALLTKRVGTLSYKEGNVTHIIKANDLSSRLKNDAQFRSKWRLAYNSRYVGLTDSVFTNIMRKFGISKRDALEGKDEKTARKTIDDNVKNGTQDTSVDGKKVNNADTGDPDADATKGNQDFADNIANDSDNIMKNGIADAEKTLTKDFLTKTLNGSKTGGIAGIVVGLACSAVELPRTMSTMTRVIHMTQLIRYSMLFLTVADKIKAGKASPTEVGLLATMLTTVLKDSKGNVTKQAGSDGFLAGWVLNGNTKLKSSQTSYRKFIPGAGWTKGLSSFSAKVPSAANTSCDFASSGPGQMIIGIAGGWTGIITTVAGLLLQDQIVKLLAPLLMKFFSAIAGTIIDNTAVGQDASDGLFSGGLNMLSETAAGGGSGALSVNDAIAYQHFNDQTQLAYAEEDRLTKSPFDIYSKNTFMGSIVNSFMPYYGQVSSLSGAMTTAFSMLGAIPSLISPVAHAADDANLRYALSETCDDPFIQEGGYAAGPACDIYFGVPVQYLDTPIETVLDTLEGQYNTETGEPIEGSKLAEYKETCTQGSSGESGADLADICKMNKTTSMYALFLNDQRAQETMDGEDTVDSPTDGASALITGSSRELAKQILANKNITLANGYDQQVKAYANGDTSCHLNPHLLQMIATVGIDYKITISSFNRFCTGILTASGNYSLHYRNGGGNAVDISMVDGSAATGGRPVDIKFMNAALKTFDTDLKIQLGQVNCRSTSVSIPSGLQVVQIDDSCNHIHIGVY